MKAGGCAVDRIEVGQVGGGYWRRSGDSSATVLQPSKAKIDRWSVDLVSDRPFLGLFFDLRSLVRGVLFTAPVG